MKLNSLVIMKLGGVNTAIGSTLLIAFNIGAELLLQLFYATSPFLGLIQWFD